MSKAVVAEARELALLMSMVLGLSAVSLAVACAAVVIADNQTLHVAVQWGIVGVIVLYAIWICHFLLFRGDGLARWIGLLVVVQNVFTSLLNSHLFDFHEGWMYVIGVGVAGGLVIQAQRAPGKPGETLS